jgi:hypothetical protein
MSQRTAKALAKLLAIAVAALLPAGALGVDPTPSYVEPSEGEGCWVLFFAEPDFKRPIGRLPGRVYVGSLTAPGKIGEVDTREFFSYVESIQVGPEASLEVYGEPMFEKRISTLKPGERIADARPIRERMQSMKILCEETRR